MPHERQRVEDKNVVKNFPKGQFSGFEMLRGGKRCVESDNLTG